jgi:hypothetical protein
MVTQWRKLFDKGYVPLRDNRENQMHFSSVASAKPVAERVRKKGYFAQVISAQIKYPSDANYYLVMYKLKGGNYR